MQCKHSCDCYVYYLMKNVVRMSSNHISVVQMPFHHLMLCMIVLQMHFYYQMVQSKHISHKYDMIYGMHGCMQIFARKGDTVFRDEIEWDLNCPSNSAAQYAAACCRDLHLGMEWYDTILSQLQTLLTQHLEVCAFRVNLLPSTCHANWM